MMNGLRGQAKRRGLPDGLTLLIGLAALAGAGLALARQATYGALLNFDSVAYIAAARNLVAGEGLAGYGGEAYITWPPLYPLMLAGGSLGVAEPLAVAGPLNAGIFGLTIFAVGRYLQRRLAHGYPAAGACFALALALPLTGLAAAALSEPLFILLATLALMRTDDYLANGRTAALLWVAALSALAWQTRYIGIVVPAFIGLAVLLQVSVPLGDRLRRVVALGLIAGLPMAAWLGRNYMLREMFTGHDAPVEYSLSGIAPDALGKLWEWAYVDHHAWVQATWLAVLTAVAAGLLIAALGAIAAGCVWARRSGGDRARWPAWAKRTCWLFGGFALAVAGVYLFSLYVLGRPPHGVDGRFFAPMYTPLVVVVAVGADRLLAFLRDGAVARRWAEIGLLATLTLWMVMQIVPNARAIAYANSDEFEHVYTAQPWVSSAILRHIREYPIMDGTVFSNRPGIVYLYNRGPDARHRTPDLDYYGQGADALALADWAAEAREGAWVVWFNEDDNFNVRDKHLPQLRAMARMMPVGEFADGAIFRVDDDYMPDAGSNPFMAAYEGIAAGGYGYAAAYSDFSVYWDDEGGRLLYLREPCAPRDIDARFLLHIYPADAIAARDGGRFVNADFDFAANGAMFEGKCVGIAPLPDYGAYGIERIITGQYVSGAAGAVWRVDVGPDSARGRRDYAEVYRAAAAGEYGAAAAQVEFAVYLADGDALVYIKEPCEPADVEARFFLHIIPVDAADLPAARAESGFDNFDFWFAEEGAVFDGKCVGVMELPGYAVGGVRTGQFVSGEGVVWRVEFGIE